MMLVQEMEEQAEEVAGFLKGLASPQRLLLLCNLLEGEKSVSELMELTQIPQTSVSQHLAKLKSEGIVAFRRDHRTLYYRICHPTALDIMNVLYAAFCGKGSE